MTDDSNVDVKDESDSFRRQKSKEEMQKQVISFALMIVFTLIAFAMVATESISRMYIMPILFIMAIVQAGFQFYYFMHVNIWLSIGGHFNTSWFNGNHFVVRKNCGVKPQFFYFHF